VRSEGPGIGHRLTARLGRHRWAVTAGGTAVFLGLSASTAPLVSAEEPAQQALQSVTIDLGTDGSVTALTSSVISRPEDAADGDEGEGGTTRSRSLDPAKSAGDLPVRITTSWRHDGRVGTDLAALDGVSGRVEISLTVQNTTVRPERFRYDAAGVPRDSYELVTTPMTVVASATLPGGTGGELVRPQPGATEPGTTNGVVSTDGDDTTVQWASLLAPPRLSASTTFTLVQDTTDFHLPAISLTAQPGLATDTSIARLVDAAFGEAAGTVSSANNTIGLIADVNATLAQVADSLQTVQQTLSVNAGEVGEAATASLTSTADAVDAAAKAVMSNLQTLGSSVGSTVDATNGQAVASLQASVQGVLDYFGTPAGTDSSAPVTGTCGTPAEAAGQAPTLLGQLSTVSRQLRQLGAASGDCVEQLRGTLRASIGDADQCAGSTTLVCRLTGASTKLVGVATNLQTQGLAALDILDDTAVDALGVTITDLITTVAGLQGKGGDLGDLVTGPAPAVLELLGDLDSGLADARTAVDTSGVAAELQELAHLAEERLAQLQNTDGDSVGDQLTELAESICTLQVAAGDGAAADADTLRRLVDGRTCDGTPVTGTGNADFPTPLTDRITEQVTAWQAVLHSVDGTDTAGAAAALTALSTQLATLDATVDEVTTLVEDGGPAGELGAAVTDLVADLDALYAAPTTPLDCANPPVVDASTPPLNALAISYGAADCGQGELAITLKTLLDQAAADVNAAAADDVDDIADAAGAAGSAADDQLEGLSSALLEELGLAADRQVEQGKAVVVAQQAALTAAQAAARSDLDATAQEAVGRLAEQVTAANQQQSAAAAALQAQLQKVLVDLGSAGQGRGLLGVMQDSAGQAGVRTEQVEQTSSAAASFRGVRLAEVADAQLEQQQLARSLQAAAQFAPFGEDLPSGSSSSTVFVYRLGGGA
jgi:hypothetical protein